MWVRVPTLVKVMMKLACCCCCCCCCLVVTMNWPGGELRGWCRRNRWSGGGKEEDWMTLWLWWWYCSNVGMNSCEQSSSTHINIKKVLSSGDFSFRGLSKRKKTRATDDDNSSSEKVIGRQLTQSCIVDSDLSFPFSKWLVSWVRSVWVLLCVKIQIFFTLQLEKGKNWANQTRQTRVHRRSNQGTTQTNNKPPTKKHQPKDTKPSPCCIVKLAEPELTIRSHIV